MGTLTGTITLGQNGLTSKSDGGILHIPKTEASPLDAIQCYTQDTPFYFGRVQSAHSKHHKTRH